LLKKFLVRVARQSPAMIVAMLALFVALTGTAVATTSALIGSAQIRNNSITGIDVKNRSLRPIDFRGSVRGPRGLRGLRGLVGPQGPAGPQGLAGAQGIQGPIGPSNAYSTAPETAVVDLGAAEVLVKSLALPAAGSYLVFSSVTLNNNAGAGLEATFSCRLVTGADIELDDGVTSDGGEVDDRHEGTLLGAGTLAAPGSVELRCSSNQDASNAVGARITAVRVGTLN
jgi:hypothetical protein